MPALSYQFLISDMNRMTYTVRSPSDYTQDKVLTLLDQNIEHARRKLYTIYAGVPTPGPRHLAANLLDAHFHGWITSGGCWELCQMKRLDDTVRSGQYQRSWQTIGQPVRWLLVNKEISIEGSDPSLPTDPMLSSAPIEVLDRSTSLLTPDHAITFQASIFHHQPHR